MEHSENIPIFNILGTLFGNIPRNFIDNFFQIFREYIMGMFHQYYTSIHLPDGYYLWYWFLENEQGIMSKIFSHFSEYTFKIQ